MKVFAVAYNNHFYGVVSNKQKLWDRVLELLGIDEQEITDKKRYLIIETYPNWIENDCMDISVKNQTKIYRQSAIYPIFKTNDNLKIIDGNDPDNAVVVWERVVND